MRPLFRLTAPLTAAVTAALTATLTGTLLSIAQAPASADNPVTPGNFTGYGFDQCLAPSSATMDTWMRESPFSAVGIYISGNSRACRNQPNLTPTWIQHQLANRWRLLPITLGPQASCLDRFPRYDDDPTINPDPTTNYSKARAQARAEATKAVSVAGSLGITAGSTLWYDLEGFDISKTHCRESAIRFLGAWTKKVRGLGYKSGVYSSAGSGIKMLDDVRVNRPGLIALPDFIWIARWDGVANTSTSFIRDDGWRPGGRMKQYRGGHNETWGGVTINIDSNFLDLGKGSRPSVDPTLCGSVRVDLASYPTLSTTNKPAEAVKALQCLLRRQDVYAGAINGSYDKATIAAVNAWQRGHGLSVSSTWSRRAWVQLLSAGTVRTLKYGMSGGTVRRVQRALVAALRTTPDVSGVFLGTTESLVRRWQGEVGLPKTGVLNPASWAVLQSGRWR